MEILSTATRVHDAKIATGRRLAAASVVSSAVLAALNLGTGWASHSTSVFSAGLEFLGDVMTSTIVLLGLRVASRPPDANHPYGHGRVETLAGFIVGVILLIAGVGIGFHALRSIGSTTAPPEALGVWALAITIAVRTLLSTIKFRAGRRIGSQSLVADAWNDAADILAAVAAIVAVVLARYNPEHFLAADHYGGFAVGVIVVLVGLRVIRESSLDLIDTMPDDDVTSAVRDVALTVPGARGVEKCFARRSGLQYQIDLHLEVDPTLTVAAGHDIATEVRKKLKERLDWVADVLVHVEPEGM
jgi:cation diffusion facilitator family transporter